MEILQAFTDYQIRVEHLHLLISMDFLPEINSEVKDESLSAGIKGSVGDWNVDFSNTYGKNSFLYVIGNTSNASLAKCVSNCF